MALHNQKALKAFRQQLRSNGTSAEAAFWLLVKNRRLSDKKFRRQHSVGPFILDFYCPEEKIAIELDGAGHADILQMDYDQERTQYLEAQGIRVIRIENRLLFESTNYVLDYIASFFERK